MKKELKLHNCIVSFIDILGSTKAIQDNAQESLNIVHDAYIESLKLFEKVFTNKRIKPMVKIFSDNIVIAANREGESGHGAFLAVCMMSAIIHLEFLKRKLLTRGAISTGNFFCDDTMVWGTGLVNSYLLENKVAIYPRIIIDPKLIGELKIAIDGEKFHSSKWLIQDNDGIFFVHYYNDCITDKDFVILLLLRIVSDKIVEYTGNPNICQKWIWYSNFLQQFIIEK